MVCGKVLLLLQNHSNNNSSMKIIKKKKILSKSVLYKRSGVVVEKSFASESMQET